VSRICHKSHWEKTKERKKEEEEEALNNDTI
jgi:hypothetical protein